MSKVSYFCVSPYKGISLLGTDIEIPANTVLPVDNGIICYIYKDLSGSHVIPVCYQHSQIAHNHFIWCNDLDRRIEIMKKIKSLLPLNKNQVDEAWKNFLFLLNKNCEDSFIFNRYYYFGSHVSELECFYNKMLSLRD